jgi:uncharacterized repeat protein (TIGR03943 family)
MRWSGVRIATGLVLGAWAGLFWFLLLFERTPLFLSSRTAWVVPTGAALLSIAAVGRLASARTAHPEPPSRRTVWMLAGLTAPVALLVSLPPLTLGANAAGTRASFAGAASVRTVEGSLDFLDVAAAQSYPEAARALARRAGEPIVLEGIVTAADDLGPDELMLTRFIVTCCTADATIAQARVVGVTPGAFAPDRWIRVRGRVFPIGREVLVAAETAEAIPTPDRPYLTP